MSLGLLLVESCEVIAHSSLGPGLFRALPEQAGSC